MSSRLAASWATTALASAALTVALTSSIPGCQTACDSGFDCGDGAYCQDHQCRTDCATDSDCPLPRCPAGATSDECVAPLALCDGEGRCRYGSGNPRPRRVSEIPDVVEGFDDAPGTGEAFIVDTLAIAPAGVGFDLDGACRSGRTDCIDNAMAPLGPLANDQIQQGVTGGQSLLLIELAGLESPFQGGDRSLTVKFYVAQDADTPPSVSNNFAPPAGAIDCCRFNMRSSEIDSQGQAISRIPARISRNGLTTLAPAALTFTLPIGAPPFADLQLMRATISARVPDDLSALRSGLLGGALPSHALALIDNPYCHALSDLCRVPLSDASLLDLVASFFQPDIDLDVPRNGLDRLGANAVGIIDECLDGRGAPVPPIDPSRPQSCTANPDLRDGYSVGFSFSAVAAAIVGQSR